MKYFIRFILISLFVPGLAGALELSADKQQWIQERLKSGELMGLMVVRIEGDFFEQQAYGRISVADPRPPAADSQFEIGSITKVFTNLLLAEMVAKGRLEYSTSLAELLPEVKFVNPAVGRITLLELGTHTSGLPRLPANLMMSDPADPYADYGIEDLLEAIASARPEQQLIKEVSYSNFGVGLLGHLLGAANNSSYFEALKLHVLTPLGMNAVTVNDTEQLLPAHQAGKVVPNWHFDSLAGAGELRMSAIELSRLLAPWLAAKSTALVHDIMADLKVVANSGSQLSVTRVWMKLGEGERQLYWHNGGTGGFSSFAGFSPATKEGWIVLSNSNFDITKFAISLFSNPPASQPEEAAEIGEKFSEYHGYFAMSKALVISIFEQQGQLFGQLTGQPPFRLAVSGKDQFTLLAVDAKLAFERDTSGTVVRAILHQNGQVMPAERVDGPVIPEFVEIKTTKAVLKEYTGSYKLAPGVDFEVRVEAGQLMVKLTGQSWLPVFAHAADKFFYKVVDAQITFNREAGEVASLTLHQNGANQVAAKF